MSAFDDVKKSETSDQLTDDPVGLGRNLRQSFVPTARRIRGPRCDRHRGVFRRLSRVSLLGTLTSKDDLLFMLLPDSRRDEPRDAHIKPTDIASGHKLLGRDHAPEGALAKLDELDLKAERRRRSAVGPIEAALWSAFP